jgi:signal peptidase I
MEKAKIRVLIFAIALILIIGVTVFQTSAILGALAKLHR